MSPDMEMKLELPPLGGLYGLKCLRCKRVMYCSDLKALTEAFDKHDCGQGNPERDLPAVAV